LKVTAFIIIFDQKPHPMKKHIAKAFVISLVIGFSVSSCELLGDCKTCSIVTYENGSEISRTPGLLTCGDELAEKESASPITIGTNRTTDYECN
jgi:hypothetical protein